MTKLRMEVDFLLEMVDVAVTNDIQRERVSRQTWAQLRHSSLAIKQLLDKGDVDASREG